MQNKLIVLLLLAKCAYAQDKSEDKGPAPKMGALPTGASSPEISKELREVMKPKDLQSMTLPPAKVESKTMKATSEKPMKMMTSQEKKKENRTIKVSSAGGAAAKLLPESADEDKKDETSAKPLLSDNDARCYAARFSDLKGNSGLTHYATVGVPQGRLGTCAKDLTDYEAETYLENFPELAQKFGRDTKGAFDAARNHYRTVGYLNSHYSTSVKSESKQTTWQCEFQKQCKCNGTLWMGAANRLDDKKPITKFDDFRLFKTIAKETAEGSNFTMCHTATFEGADPLPGVKKTCFCEDRPVYAPNLCADDGEDCVCSGYVTYGKKFSAAKKVLDFKAHVEAGNFAVAEVKEGTKSLSCAADAFGGVDPVGAEKEVPKACFCDQRKKMFNRDSLKSIQELWKAKNAIAASSGSIASTGKVLDEVKAEIKTKTDEWAQTVEAQETERKVATEALEAQKKCVLQAKEAAKRYKLEQIRKKYDERKRNLELQRQKLAKWKGQIALKTQAMNEACALSQKSKVPAEKARLTAECKRLKEEVEQATTDVNIESTKTEEAEKKETEEEATATGAADGKGDDEESSINAKTETEKATIEADVSETVQGVLTEKVDIAQKKLEILKFQEKTQNEIAAALRKKRQALLAVIKLENERLAKLTREEESTVDVEDGEAEAKATVTSKVTGRAEATIASATSRIASNKEKVTYLVTKISGATTKGVALRETVTKLKTLMDTKTAELLELTKTLGSKQEFAEKNPTVASTATAIAELKVEIEAAEKLIKATRTEYVAAYAESTGLQRLIEHFSTQKREYEAENKVQEELVEEQKAVIIEQEENAKLRKTVEDTTKAQQVVFTSHQKVVELEEELSEAKKTKEEKLAALNAEKGQKEKELKVHKDELKKLEAQKATLEASLKTTTGKNEITRITQEITGVTTGITKATTRVTAAEQAITGITTDVTAVTTEATAAITELTTKLTAAKADAEKDEEAAAKAVNKLPGTPGTDVKITGGVIDKKDKGGANQFGGKGGPAKPAGAAATTTSTKETSTVGGPTSGITDVASTVVKVTEEAKKRRVDCTRATKRLANQKDIIAKYVTDIKAEIAENKALVEECKGKLKDEQLEYAKTQADANAIAAKDPSKFQELSLKLKALQLAMENEGKKCNDDEEDEAGMRKKITAKKDEVGELVKFVKQACAEATQSEEEVAQTIGIITQIEVVNRLYDVYVKSVQALGAQERLWDQQRAVYEAERARVGSLLQETKRRIQVAEQTIVTLKEQEKEAKAKPPAKEAVAKEQEAKVKALVAQQEEIIKTETAEETRAAKMMEELEVTWEKTLKGTQKLKRDLKRAQESYEDSQRKLRKEVDVKSKLDEYRKRVESGKKTLQQKQTQIAKIMEQLAHEVEESRARISKLEEQVEDCTKQTTMARTAITTLSSKQQTLDASSKQLKGSDLTKVKSAIEKIEAELEGAKNQMSVAESTCSSLKEDITKATSTVVQYNQEFKYYEQILGSVKKEIEETEKAEVKVEEEKEEEKAEEKADEKKDEKKDDKKEDAADAKADDKKEEKKEAKPKKEKAVTSSTSNEVKQIESQEETTVAVTKELEKELEETDQKITDTTEEIVKQSEQITKEEGEAVEEKKDLETVTRRELRQKCAVLFPAVFTQFTKSRSHQTTGMCPCQGSATGTSMITVAVDAAEEADKVVQALFLKKLATEARFLTQVQRTSMGAENKLVVEGEKNGMSLVILTSDDKVTGVLSELEEGDVMKKGQAIVSPLLNGKREYMKWVQESLNSVKATAASALLDTAAKATE